MLHQNQIHSVVQSHKILLDTSFAMQPGFSGFVQTFVPAFRRNPILIPALVLWELKNHCRTQDPDSIARSTLELIVQLIRSRLADVRYEACDLYQDLVILRVTLQHILTHDIVVLTNDCRLMLDLRTMWSCESVRYKRRLEILKIHGRTQHPCSFEPSEFR